MKCDKVRVQLQDYPENRLMDKRRRREIERHLADCPDCRAELAFLKVYRAKLGSMAPQAAPPDLLVKIRRQLSLTAPNLKKGFWRAFRPLPVLLPGLAGTALLAVLVVCLVRPWHFDPNGQTAVKNSSPPAAATAPAAASDRQVGQAAKATQVVKVTKPETPSRKRAAAPQVAVGPKRPEDTGLTQGQELALVKGIPAGPAAASGPSAEKSVGPLLKSIDPINQVKSLMDSELALTVLVPAAPPRLTKSVVASPDETERVENILLRLKTLLRSIDGISVREEENDRLELPLSLSIVVTPENYPRLIAGLRELGEVTEPAFSIGPDDEDLRFNLKIDIQTGNE